MITSMQTRSKKFTLMYFKYYVKQKTSKLVVNCQFVEKKNLLFPDALIHLHLTLKIQPNQHDKQKTKLIMFSTSSV